MGNRNKPMMEVKDWEISEEHGHYYLAGFTDDMPGEGRNVPVWGYTRTKEQKLEDDVLYFETEEAVYRCPLRYLSSRPYKKTVPREKKGKLRNLAKSGNPVDELIRVSLMLSLEKDLEDKRVGITPEEADFSGDEYLARIKKLQETVQLERQAEEEAEDRRLIEKALEYEDCIYLELARGTRRLAYHIGDRTGTVKPERVPKVPICWTQEEGVRYRNELLDFRYTDPDWNDCIESSGWSSNIKQAVIKNELAEQVIFNGTVIAKGETKVIDPLPAPEQKPPVMREMSVWEFLTGEIPKEFVQETENGIVFDLSAMERGSDSRELIEDMADERPFDEGYAFSRDAVERLKAARIRIPEEGVDVSRITDTKRPFYMIRGKTISREQVRELLRDRIQWPSGEAASAFPKINTDIFGKLFLEDSDDDDYGGWLWDTGEIGGNRYWSYKYPDFSEIVPPWIELAMEHSFLDLVVGFTNHHEQPCYLCPVQHYYFFLASAERKKPEGNDDGYEFAMACADEYREKTEAAEAEDYPCRREKIEECTGHFKKQFLFPEKTTAEQRYDGEDYNWIVDVPQLSEDVVLTIKIKDGIMELFTGEEAKRVFREYDEKYHFADPRRYSTVAMEYFHTDRVGEAFRKWLHECR